MQAHLIVKDPVGQLDVTPKAVKGVQKFAEGRQAANLSVEAGREQNQTYQRD